jgi:very-short-patch-repair endonuclease
MLSHATALWWHGLIDKQPWPSHVSTPRRCLSLRGVIVHGRRPCERIWLELDGRKNHSSWAQIQNDRSKELRVRAGGFELVRFGTRQLEEEPALVEADLRRGLHLPA